MRAMPPLVAARRPAKRSFLDLVQATPAELAAMLISDGLLSDLQGNPCVCSRSEMHVAEGLLGNCTLGHLRASSHVQNANIEGNNVFYRCTTCRKKVAINEGSTIYPNLAGTSDVTQRTLAYWYVVHGFPTIMIARHLMLSRDRLRSYQATVRAICERDALRKEQNIVFGGLGSLTTDIECGTHTWCRWKVGERWYRFVWIGLIERRARSQLLLRPIISDDSTMLSGVTYGSRSIVTETCMKSICQEAFTTNTNAIMMTNEEKVYRSLEVRTLGICEKYLVEHSSFEYVRSEKVRNCMAFLRPDDFYS